MKASSKFVRCFAAILSLVMLTASTVFFPITAADAVLWGDTNGDGTVDSKDLSLLRKYMASMDYTAGTSPVAVSKGADANGDGTIDSKDLSLLRRYFASYDYASGFSSVYLGPASERDIPVDSNIMNILILGTDALTKTANGRSDSMIVVTINLAKKRIVLTSIQRDLYVHIPYNTAEHPDGVWNKINSAHNFGNIALLEKTIDENFGIHIDRYIKARYADFVRVYQLLGGVEISLSQKEIEYINDGLANDPSMQEIYQAFAAEGFALNHTGELPLDIVGKKTTLNSDALFIYARARKVVYNKNDPACAGTEIVNSNDTGRTDRQRLILMRTMEKVKSMSLYKQMKLLNECLPVVTTDLTFEEFRYFVTHAASLAKYEVVEARFPCSGSWDYGHTGGGTSILVIIDGGYEKIQTYWYNKVYGK